MRIEQLPKSILCVPLVAQWFWLATRHRSLTLPSAINPGIETGGLAGESKAACLALIGDAFAGHVAPWRLIAPGDTADALCRAADIGFPLIAKPDIGWCGHGVQTIADEAALAAYVAALPPDAAFMIQRLIAGPGEAGLFYVRAPDAAAGRITGLTLRHPPIVTGDGRRSVAALIAADPWLRAHRGHYQARLGSAAMDRVPALREVVTLSAVWSIRLGARYADGTALVTPALDAALEAIARSMGAFHFGRFDVRFTTRAALQRGEFQIIEVNGAGSEAIHLWDPALAMRTAFAGVFAKQRLLFAMGAAMRARGHRPSGVVRLSRAWLHQRALIRRYPASG